MKAAQHSLRPGGLLLIYGPFFEADIPTAASNESFDTDLRHRNPAWGLRHLHEVQAQAQRSGLALQTRVAMPANNLLLVLRAQVS